MTLTDKIQYIFEETARHHSTPPCIPQANGNKFLTTRLVKSYSATIGRSAYIFTYLRTMRADNIRNRVDVGFDIARLLVEPVRDVLPCISDERLH